MSDDPPTDPDASSVGEDAEGVREWADRWRPARKKPIEVEFRGPYRDPSVVETIEGDFEIDDAYIEEHGGFVIIRGVNGEEYPCALDIFHDTYDVLSWRG